MRKMIVAATVAALFALPALADDKPGLNTDEAPRPAHKLNDGYRGAEEAHSMTVDHVTEMHDDASVTLRGNLIAKKGNDIYTFRDKTGQIDAYIPIAVFTEREVSPDQLISISGSLDKQQTPPRIKVSRLQKE